jgi:hypothetical protein
MPRRFLRRVELANSTHNLRIVGIPRAGLLLCGIRKPAVKGTRLSQGFLGQLGPLCPVATKLEACSLLLLSCTIHSPVDATPQGRQTLKPPVCQFSDESF